MIQYLLSVMKGQRVGFFDLLIKYLLFPWSLIYGLGVFCHRNFYRLKGVYKASKTVISIGNISVGGVGKTPLVIWLAKHLQDKGFKSIILIRGYMPRASKVSDEVDMLNEQIPYIPVIPGANRVKSIRMAEEILPVDVYICDDAFQHWPLGRDLNIVAIDTVNPFGNGFLLPAGILREPRSALKRAHVLVLTKTSGSRDTSPLILKLKKINAQALIVESTYKSAGVVDVFDSDALSADYLKDKKTIGFCAIGDPLSFESELRNTGAQVEKVFTFMDHHVYKKDDIQRLLAYARFQGINVLVTTHKDAVKLRVFKETLKDFKLVYIPIQLEITKGSDEFIQKIVSVCSH